MVKALSPSPFPSLALSNGVRLALWGLAATTVSFVVFILAAGKDQSSCRTVSGAPEPSTVDLLATTARSSGSGSEGLNRQLEAQAQILLEREDAPGQQTSVSVGGGKAAAAWSGDGSLYRTVGRSLRKLSDASVVQIVRPCREEKEEEQQEDSTQPRTFPTADPPAVEVGYRGGFEGFPPLEESTLMFMHIFKCAGSTLRHMLVDWAEETGEQGAIVRECDYIKPGEICLRAYKLIDEAVQVEQISHLKVLAGHFMWGFQRHVQTPYLMVTALRNPLEVFVSGEQYINRNETSTLPKANEFIVSAMNRTMSTIGPLGLQQGQVSGFIRRLAGVPREVWFRDGLEAGADDAIRNLETFWIVGVVEQYVGFEKVLQESIDPGGNHRELWRRYAEAQYNSSPVKTRDILAEIDPDLVQRFNSTLALQWKVYERAVSLWDARCREVLPEAEHQEMCTVPPPP